MKLASGLWIERQIELIFPTKLEAGLADGVVPVLSAGMTFGEIGGVGGDFVGDDAVFDVFLVWQTKVFFRGDVTEHGAALTAHHRGRRGPSAESLARGRGGGDRA